MKAPALSPRARTSALRPATYAGLAAALLSITAALAIRFAPALETAVAAAHLVATFLLYVTAGALVSRMGAQGWRGGMFAGLVDALVGHPIAYLLAPALDPSKVTLPPGLEPTPAVLATAQQWGAVVGAGSAIVIALAGGALGGWYARRNPAP
jgi:hypothetical protein